MTGAAICGASDVRQGIIGKVSAYGMPDPSAFVVGQPGRYRRPHRWQESPVVLDEKHPVGEVDAVALGALLL